MTTPTVRELYLFAAHLDGKLSRDECRKAKAVRDECRKAKGIQ